MLRVFACRLTLAEQPRLREATLVKAKAEGKAVDAADIRRKERALGMKRTRARQRVAADKARLRVDALKVRAAELEEELRAARAAA